MSLNTWNETVGWSSGDGTALTNSTTATSILQPSAKYTFPAGALGFVGKRIGIRLFGRISTVATTPGTLTLTVRLGSVTVFTGPAMALNTTAQTNASWLAEMELEVRSIGASTSATILGTGSFISRAVIGSAAAGSGGVGALLLPDTAPAAGTGFDSTAAQQIDVFATWSVANASNSIQVHQSAISLLN